MGMGFSDAVLVFSGVMDEMDWHGALCMRCFEVWIYICCRVVLLGGFIIRLDRWSKVRM